MISKIIKENYGEDADTTYNDFVYRFVLAEQLKKADKGVIIVGNTRSGKSTIFSGLAGSPLKIIYHDAKKKTFIQPENQKFQEYVKADMHTSHTEVPNVYFVKDGNQILAYVDMPGYADSSPFRELVNFKYIKTMTQNLKSACFLMVITVAPIENNYKLEENQIKMMTSFMNMFVNCSDYVRIIVNKVQKSESIENSEAKIKECIKLAIKSNKDEIFQEYYSKITPDKISILQRPIYKKLHRIDKYELSQEVLNLPKISQYLQMSKLEYNRPILVQRGNSKEKKDFDQKIKGYIESAFSQISSIYKLIKKILNHSLIFYVERENIESKTKKLKQILEKHQQSGFKFLNPPSQIQIITPHIEDIKKLSTLPPLLIKFYAQLTEKAANYDFQDLKYDLSKYYSHYEERTIGYLYYCKKVLLLQMDKAQSKHIESQINELILRANRKYQIILFLQTVSFQGQPNAKKGSASLDQKVFKQAFVNKILTNEEQKQKQKIDSKTLNSNIFKICQMLLKQEIQQNLSAEEKEEILKMYQNMKQLHIIAELGAKICGQKIEQEDIWKSLIDHKILTLECKYILNDKIDGYSIVEHQAKILELLAKYKPNDLNKIKLVEKLAYFNQYKLNNPQIAIRLYMILKRFFDAFELLKSNTNDMKFQFLIELGDQFAQNLRNQYALYCYQIAEKLDKYNYSNITKAQIKINEIYQKTDEHLKKRKSEMAQMKGFNNIDFNKINNINKDFNFKIKQNPEEKSADRSADRSPRISTVLHRRSPNQFTFTKQI